MAANDQSRYSLETNADGEPTERALQVATIALLVEMAKVDHDVDRDEISLIVRSVNHAFDLVDDQTGELLEIARFMLSEENAVNKFVDLIDTKFNVDQKQRVMGMVWKVIASDGTADKYETGFAAHLRMRLNLTLEQAVRARQLAEAGEFDPVDFELVIDSEEDEDEEEN